MRTLRNNRVIFSDNGNGIAHRNEAELPIIAVDFDGTLVFNKYPYIENPNIELIDFIKENRLKYVWILWTCRKDEQLAMAVDYMRTEHGITFDYINRNTESKIAIYGDTRKVFADYYIDDRNVDFKNFLKNKKGLNG